MKTVITLNTYCCQTSEHQLNLDASICYLNACGSECLYQACKNTGIYFSTQSLKSLWKHSYIHRVNITRVSFEFITDADIYCTIIQICGANFRDFWGCFWGCHFFDRRFSVSVRKILISKILSMTKIRGKGYP